MIEEQGIVVALAGNFAEVRTERRSTCGGCSAGGTCGTSLLDRVLGRRSVLLRARNCAGAEVGDQVVVGVSEAGLLTASLAAYLVPILGLVAGAALGQRLSGAGGGDATDSWALAGALLGFLLALFWLRRYSAALARDPGRQPTVLRRLGGGPLSLPVSLPGR